MLCIIVTIWNTKMAKLTKSSYPSNHRETDFKCFGPAATKDGQFDGTMLCDMGCFTQGEVDSNKYYHAAVVQSTQNGKWYAYFEFGRVGVENPQFQFVECGSQAEAQQTYSSQLHSKNDKRGQWVQHPSLGKVLRPKEGKDCYLVRPQTTRSTGLPDARTITTVDAAKATVVKQGKGASASFDSPSLSLLNDLNIGTISYTRSSMVNDAIPTKEAVDEARVICSEAQVIINKRGENKEDKDLKELTSLLYSRIPKRKDRSQTDWVLDATKIQGWLQDLDAYEAAIVGYNSNSVVQTTTDYPFHLRHLAGGELRDFVKGFFLGATRNVHSYVSGHVNILNVFEVERQRDKHVNYSKGVIRTSRETPLHQPGMRLDIDENHAKLFNNSGTWLLLHGTRTVNVGGILRESLRLPKTLSTVHISGAMFGSGIYFADDYKKSLGYTSYERGIYTSGAGGIKGRGAFMFVCDVTLGNPYVAPRSQAFAGPPNGHHSIYGKSGHSGVQNNEYIVFNTQAFNLRYLVEFK
jgi:hypothetical protein